MTASRRRAAILAADVAGYSRLIGVDEDVSRVNVPAYAAGIPKSRVAIGARALSDRSLRNFVDFSV
jgi:hypothetical protein